MFGVQSDDDKYDKYVLKSIIHHEGPLSNCGHCFTEIKIKNEWFTFNDDKEIKKNEKLKINDNETAYVLFF